ncbi:MAG: hypothetical protein P4L31_03740 [Candidatus Babeliales bacterium]|nr:hypothetical protein [Candidatus Babeliales bacterium]
MTIKKTTLGLIATAIIIISHKVDGSDKPKLTTQEKCSYFKILHEFSNFLNLSEHPIIANLVKTGMSTCAKDSTSTQYEQEVENIYRQLGSELGIEPPKPNKSTNLILQLKNDMQRDK